ncbi:EP1-like glycoprotein 3 [Linum perenne]
MRWVWEANRGTPVGENATFSLGENGNLVLAHQDGQIAWQSNTANKGVTGFQLFNNGNMVLRNSRENQNGPYSFVMEPRDLALYFTEANRRTPSRYFSFAAAQRLFIPSDDLWALDTKCQLPSRCGEFGVCEDSQCVACPTANGLMGWSKDCKPPAVDVNNCSGGGRKFRYFELKEIDHFMAKYTRGDAPVKKAACEEKCSKDCKCLGYFYQSDSSRCWIAYELKTMSRVANQTHLAYIKTPIA